MKKILLSSLLLWPVVMMAQDTTFTIKGSIGKLDIPAKAYLSYRNADGNVLDSVMIRKGQFIFKGAVTAPVMATLSIDHKGEGRRKEMDALVCYIDHGSFQLLAKDSVKHAVIKNSLINDAYHAYQQHFAAVEPVLKSLDARWARATDAEKKGTALRDSMMGVATPLFEEKKRLQRVYVQEHPESYFSLLALKEFAGSSIDYGTVAPLFNNLSVANRNSKTGVEFAKRLDIAKLTAIGAMAPGFTQNDVSGHPVNLSDFNGRYVLIDFWASWCGPCRGENPNVVKAYQQFKDKGFTILGISLDQDKEAWVKAIEADKLAWTQVSDLKFWKNAVALQYGIRSIPANLLLDKNGKIIARDLRGEALEKKLAELMN
ncbi:redoxin domain-containing protein [Chitinophaga sp. 22321]|uniref:AhpC/TSA family protein n=1 Tax=Chitinophaga hostae TaxID=2831022 RepID=A0ABS5J0J2_9BACT|nr:TlpA disulfide reductase family protein [Chitinophaga hostae]MBS0028566.1 AhpC/TSA family protein [Chitinophaga hostae]